MIDISVSGLSKYFGDVLLFENVSFELYAGQKAALIGANGTGKTTLFRILAGLEIYEEGSVALPAQKKLGMLDQLPNYNPSSTVRDVMEGAFAPVFALERKMKALETRMAAGESGADVLAQYGALQQRFEAADGYATETELQKIVSGLGIGKDFLPRSFAQLSGGEQTRVNLGRMLLEKTDIMLLDEPTNHLDMEAITWLETYLKGFAGTVLVISHDRYFLDQVTERTIELENNTAEVYKGSYSVYIEEKEQRRIEREKRFKQEQKEIDRLSFTAARMRGWGTGNKQMMRKAIALERRIQRLKDNQTERTQRQKSLGGKLSQAGRSGDDVLYVENLSKGYDGKTILENISLEVQKDEWIALLGPNGAGKTTLLRLLLGDEAADSGRFRWGSNVKLAVLPQKVEFADENATVLETVTKALNMTEPSARNRLGAYLFSGEDVFKPVFVLSGGEKSRLRLCIMLYADVNTLILDEPTNHLDIASREWLEGLLEKFEGTVLFVSHDRYFINRFATRVWAIENNQISDFQGTYDEYLHFLEQKQAQTAAETQKPSHKIVRKAKPSAQNFSKRKDALEAEISALESRKSDLEQAMFDAGFDYARLETLAAELHETEAKAADLYKALETLYAEAEEAAFEL